MQSIKTDTSVTAAVPKTKMQIKLTDPLKIDSLFNKDLLAYFSLFLPTATPAVVNPKGVLTALPVQVDPLDFLRMTYFYQVQAQPKLIATTADDADHLRLTVDYALTFINIAYNLKVDFPILTTHATVDYVVALDMAGALQHYIGITVVNRSIPGLVMDALAIRQSTLLSKGGIMSLIRAKTYNPSQRAVRVFYATYASAKGQYMIDNPNNTSHGLKFITAKDSDSLNRVIRSQLGMPVEYQAAKNTPADIKQAQAIAAQYALIFDLHTLKYRYLPLRAITSYQDPETGTVLNSIPIVQGELLVSLLLQVHLLNAKASAKLIRHTINCSKDAVNAYPYSV